MAPKGNGRGRKGGKGGPASRGAAGYGILPEGDVNSEEMIETHCLSQFLLEAEDRMDEDGLLTVSHSRVSLVDGGLEGECE